MVRFAFSGTVPRFRAAVCAPISAARSTEEKPRAAKRAMRSVADSRPVGRLPSGDASEESSRPTFTRTVGPPGQVLIAWAGDV